MVKYSDEIDVYTIPHKRMKNAIQIFAEQITLTDFDDRTDFKSLLKLLNRAFTEFEIHEKIENECIIKELDQKLKKLSILDVKVCECHRDSKLREMKSMFADGLKISSGYNPSKLSDFGCKLKEALTEFTQTFIPHMEEEEEVFQPLLMQYFTYEELINLKQTVMARHVEASKIAGGFGLFHGLTTNPPYSDLVIHFPTPTFLDTTLNSEIQVEISSHFLPLEIYMKIFNYLGPKDLLRCSQVNHYWHQLARRQELWKTLSPLKWIKSGDWKFYRYSIDEISNIASLDESKIAAEEGTHNIQDFDYDSGYYDGMVSQTMPTIVKNGGRYNESKVLIGIIKYLMPDVGPGIKALDLSRSSKLNNFFLRKMLSYCPRLEYLDVSYTSTSDSAFQDWHMREGFCSNLKHLDLSGCSGITNTTLLYLSEGLTQRHYESATDPNPYKSNGQLSQIMHPSLPNNTSRACSKGYNSCHNTCQNMLNGTCESDLLAYLPACLKSQRKKTNLDPTTGSYHRARFVKKLRWLSLSGCHKVSDMGLKVLTFGSFLPDLVYVDLSGMPFVSRTGLEILLTHAHSLKPQNLYYCDNIVVDGDSALQTLSNGCQNLQCSTRFCCRGGE